MKRGSIEYYEKQIINLQADINTAESLLSVMKARLSQFKYKKMALQYNQAMELFFQSLTSKPVQNVNIIIPVRKEEKERIRK